MTKTTSSTTTSHVTPVKKATPGKSLMKNKLSHMQKSPGHHWINQVRHPCWQQRRCRQCCCPNQPRPQVQCNPTPPILCAVLTLLIYRTTPKKNRTLLTFAIPLMSRVNAWNTCLMQEISLSVKKANWRSFWTTSSLKIFKWLSLNWLPLLEVQLLQHFFQCPQRKWS